MIPPDAAANDRVLVVAEDASVRETLAGMLRGDGGFTVTEAATGPDGVALATGAGETPFTVVFVVLRELPDAESLEAVRRIWDADEDVQVVLVGPGPDVAWGEQVAALPDAARLALLRRPLDGAEVRQIAHVLQRKWALSRHSRVTRLELERTVVGRTRELEQANRTLQDEVAERKAMESLLRHHAYHDTLTGLANRVLLKDRLERCLDLARRRPDYRFALLFLDVDNFKVINDSLGHDAGDELLVQITQRLMHCLRSVDTVVRHDENIAARLGGDEFVIVLEGIGRSADAAVVCERILEQLEDVFELNGHEVTVSASIGVAMSKPGYTGADDLLRDADIAMYRAKSAGKSRYALFDRRMHEEAVTRLHLENDLRRALERDQFDLIYQPIVTLAKGRICGFEALIRWHHPERGLVPPDEFIPIAEETGLIVPIGEWVLHRACRQLRRWDESGVTDGTLAINVNLSRRQLLEHAVIDEVRRGLGENKLDGHRLNLEITESVIIRDADAAARQLEQIKAMGVRIQMDDFGTGYSSLSCLHRFPLDVVKIDRAFMATVEENRDYAAIIHGIVTIAHNLGMRVTIEGVETTAQLAQVLALDCDFAQGYLFSAPLDAAAAEEMLRSERVWSVPAA